MRKFVGLLILGVVCVVGLGGCISTPPGTTDNGVLINPQKDTPRQVYNKLVRDYQVVDRDFAFAQFFAGIAGHPLPSSVVDKFHAAQAQATAKMNQAAVYLQAHPEIMDVPAAQVVGMNAASILLDALGKYTKTPGPDFLPPALPPETAPSSLPVPTTSP